MSIGNGKHIVAKMEGALAVGLLRGAIYFQTQLRERLQRKTNDYANSNPSKTGEYPAKVSGALGANILYEPTSPAAIALEGAVRVGYGKDADYGAILELQRQRLGLEACLNEIREPLTALIMEGAAEAAK